MPDTIKRGRANDIASVGLTDLRPQVLLQLLFCHNRSLNLVEFELKIIGFGGWRVVRGEVMNFVYRLNILIELIFVDVLI